MSIYINVGTYSNEGAGGLVEGDSKIQNRFISSILDSLECLKNLFESFVVHES